MCFEFKLLDHFTLTHRLNRNFACQKSDDNRIYVLADQGIYVLRLKCNITNPFPELLIEKEFFKISGSSTYDYIDLDINNFSINLPRLDFYEAVLQTEFSTNLKHTTPPQISAIYAEWSPHLRYTGCLLGVLTNFNSLEIYARITDLSEIAEYKSVCNITEIIACKFKDTWRDVSKFINAAGKYEEIKKRVEYAAPTAFTWSHVYNVNEIRCFALFVGHMNGDISIWRLKENKLNLSKKLDLDFLGRFCTELTNITCMYWYQTTITGGGLSLGDSRGIMNVLNISNLDKENAMIGAEVSFWSDIDNVSVDRICVMKHNNTTFILLIKQSFLIIYGITVEGTVFCKKIYRAGNLYITGVYITNNILLLLTLTGVFKQLTLTVENGDIIIEDVILPLKIDLRRFRTHGFFFTTNKVILGVLATPNHISNTAKGRNFVHGYFFHNINSDPFELLMNNKTVSLRDHWDCFETLRVLCLKEKRFPWNGINPNLNYDTLTLVQLKTLRWIAKLSEEIFNVVSKLENYHIKPYIILHYLVNIKLATKRINKLLHLRNSGTQLTTFQMRSIDLLNFFLKEMIVRDILPKANVGRTFVDEVYRVMSMANELKYPNPPQCHWCGENILLKLNIKTCINYTNI